MTDSAIFGARARGGRKIPALRFRVFAVCAIAALSAIAGETGAAPAAEAHPAVTPVEAAKSALADGLYELAATNCVNVFDAPDADPAACREMFPVYCRALHELGDHAALLRELDGRAGLAKSLEPPFGEAFWRATSLLAMGRPSEALETASAAAKEAKRGNALDALRRLEAAAMIATGDTESALGVFKSIDADSASAETRCANLLDWARALIESGAKAEAAEALERQSKLGCTNSFLAEGMLIRASMLRGSREVDAAANLLSDVSNAEWATPLQRAFAFADLAGIAAADPDGVEAAMADVERAMALPVSQTDAWRVGMRCGERLLGGKSTVDAGAGIMKAAIRMRPDGIESAKAQLALAEAYAAHGNPTNAAAEFQAYLESYDEPSLLPAALRGRAWALFDLGQFDAAATAFRKASDAAAAAMNVEWQVECRFKEADSLLADKRFADAAERYARIVADFPESASAPRALFLVADTLERSSSLQDAIAAYQDVTVKFPDSPAAAHAFYRLGAIRERRGETDAAIKAYSGAISATRDDSFRARALLGRGRARCATFRFGDARGDLSAAAVFEETAEEAEFLSIHALYGMGLDDEALNACEQFLKKRPDSRLCPDATIWKAKHYHNHTNYELSGKLFLEVVGKWPTNRWADAALLWAGRAAMQRADYQAAQDILSRMPAEYPKSNRLAEARFVQADALGELARFEDAILLLDEFTTRWRDSEWAAAAMGRKGDCLFSLGADDPARYEEAMRAYRAVLDCDTVSFAQALQSEFKIGRCMEKTGRADDAIKQYHAVVDRFRKETTAGAGTDESAQAWFTKAAFQAADLLVARGDSDAAQNVLQHVVEARCAGSDEAAARIERMRPEFKWNFN